MSKPKLSAKDFNALFPLLLEQPWLLECYDALEDLTSLCSYETQKSLIYALLHRFSYLDERQFDLISQGIIRQVFDVWCLPRGQTQIVATTSDENPDGAQILLDSLRGHLAEEGIGLKDVKLVNRFGAAVKNLYENPNVVLYIRA